MEKRLIPGIISLNKNTILEIHIWFNITYVTNHRKTNLVYTINIMFFFSMSSTMMNYIIVERKVNEKVYSDSCKEKKTNFSKSIILH